MKYITAIAAIASVNAYEYEYSRCDFDLSKEIGSPSYSKHDSTNIWKDGVRTITNPEDGWNVHYYGLKPGVNPNDVRCDFKVVSIQNDLSYLQIG